MVGPSIFWSMVVQHLAVVLVSSHEEVSSRLSTPPSRLHHQLHGHEDQVSCYSVYMMNRPEQADPQRQGKLVLA